MLKKMKEVPEGLSCSEMAEVWPCGSNAKVSLDRLGEPGPWAHGMAVQGVAPCEPEREEQGEQSKHGGRDAFPWCLLGSIVNGT